MVVAGGGRAKSGRPGPSTAALGPGFRFHPTDEELVRYFLKRKVTGKPLRFDCIAEIDLYKFDPWDLPEHSLLKTRDLEWYFYTALDKKYGHGSRANRATGQGYWKTTGKDHPVLHQARVVGLWKTLVYHTGRAPNGERTNWVMHEYRLEDEELVQGGISQDACVLCRVFQKSGAGPKNGEHYGAPFIEEEWEDEMHGIDLQNLNTDDNTTEGVGCKGVDAMQQPVKITSQTGTLTLGLTDSNSQCHMSQPCLNEQMLMKGNDNATCHVKFPDEDYIEMNDVITPMNDGCSSYLHDENTLNEFLSGDVSFLQQDDHIGGGDLVNIPETGLSENDWVEEILKHISDVDDNLQTCSTLNTFSLSGHQSGITEIPVTAQASQERDIVGPSSSKRKANSSHNGFKQKAIGDSGFIECPDAAGDVSFLQQDDHIGGGDLVNIPETGLSENDWVEEILKHISDVDDNLQTCSTLNTFSLSGHQSGITEIPVTAQASQERDIVGPSSSKRKANSSHNGFKQKAIGDSGFIECPDAAGDVSFLQQDDHIGGGDLVNIPETGLSENDWVEEILKHISDVDDNLQTCSTLNTFSLSGHQSGITEIPVTAQASQERDIVGPSSSKRKANSSHNGFKQKAIGDSGFIECPDAADIWNKDFNDGWGKPLAKRLHGMLGSIPSSPAFAAESPFKGKAKVLEHEPGVTLAGPVLIQSGIFHVGDNYVAHLIPQNWLLTKEGITQKRFLITCATESQIRKQKVATFSQIQSAVFLCFMWVVLFAIGVKIGVCVYAR